MCTELETMTNWHTSLIHAISDPETQATVCGLVATQPGVEVVPSRREISIPHGEISGSLGTATWVGRPDVWRMRPQRSIFLIDGDVEVQDE